MTFVFKDDIGTSLDHLSGIALRHDSCFGVVAFFSTTPPPTPGTSRAGSARARLSRAPATARRTSSRCPWATMAGFYSEVQRFEA